MRHIIVLLVVALMAAASAAQAQSKCPRSEEVTSFATQVERLQARIRAQKCKIGHMHGVNSQLRGQAKRLKSALGDTRTAVRAEREKYADARRRSERLRALLNEALARAAALLVAAQPSND